MSCILEKIDAYKMVDAELNEVLDLLKDESSKLESTAKTLRDEI